MARIMNSRSTFVLFGLLTLTVGVSSSVVDLRNETIACVFREYDLCYRDIATMGSNFSVKFDETPQQLNLTCKAESKAIGCISNIPTICNSVKTTGIAVQINNFIHQLCANKSTEQISFLNSTYCYNYYQNIRERCVRNYSPGGKTDAKSLCCSNANTLECMSVGMSNFCPRNTTGFMNHMMSRYRSQHSAVCGPYMKYCSTASTSLVSILAVLLSTVISLIVQKM